MLHNNATARLWTTVVVRWAHASWATVFSRLQRTCSGHSQVALACCILRVIELQTGWRSSESVSPSKPATIHVHLKYLKHSTAKLIFSLHTQGNIHTHVLRLYIYCTCTVTTCTSDMLSQLRLLHVHAALLRLVPDMLSQLWLLHVHVPAALLRLLVSDMLSLLQLLMDERLGKLLAYSMFCVRKCRGKELLPARECNLSDRWRLTNHFYTLVRAIQVAGTRYTVNYDSRKCCAVGNTCTVHV